MKPVLIQVILVCLSTTAWPQSGETEFPTGFSHQVEIGIGAVNVWQYKNTRSYFNTLQYAPTLTLPGNRFRVAPVMGIAYPGTGLNFQWGLRTSCRIHTSNFEGLGSVYNIHILADGWRNEGHYLVGGGIGTELGQLLLVSFKNLYNTETREIWSLLSFGVALYPGKKRGRDSEHYTP